VFAGAPANTGDTGDTGTIHRVAVACFAAEAAPTKDGDAWFLKAQRQNPYLHAQIGVLRNES